MPLQPDQPFPKARGDAIRAEDWNETVAEVVRLEQAKLNQAGGTVSGNLTVTGTFSAGTISGNLAARSVTSDKIATGAVTSDKIAAGAVNGSKILPGSIGTPQLAGAMLFDFTFTTVDVLATQNIAVIVDEDAEGNPRGSQLLIFAYTNSIADLTFTVKYNFDSRHLLTVAANNSFRSIQAHCRIYALYGFS